MKKAVVFIIILTIIILTLILTSQKILDMTTSTIETEIVTNSFFPNDYLSLAKERSKQERDSKHIVDSSFTYGEIVFHFLYNTHKPNINLDIQIYGLYI